MAYRPKHPVIIVVNADGGGYVRQFDTMSEAKEFYKTITTDGVAYLYASTKASLAFGEASDSIPEYDNGMTYGTGALVKLNGTVYSLINFIGAGGYGPVTHPSAWTTDVTLPPPAPPISSTGSNEGVQKGMSFTVNQLPSGNPFLNPPSVDDILLSTTEECGFVRLYDRDGVEFNGSFLNQTVKRYSSGRVDYETKGQGNSPCFYPIGFRIDNQFLTSEVKIDGKIIYSLDFGGTVYGPYYNPRYILRNPVIYTVADGDGGTTQVRENGVCRIEERQNNVPDKITWVDYAVGDSPYSFNDVGLGITERIGQPIPNGRYLVTYKVDGDERIHSGAWVGRIENVDEGIVVWKFEAQTPDQPPPPPCSVRRPVANPVNGESTVECDPTIIYPFSVYEDCEPPLTVMLEGQTITLGTNTKRGMDNGYGEVIWGQCTGMVYVANGTLVLSGTNLNYFSDGEGSYYIEDKNANPCPPEGSIISNEQTDITVIINNYTYNVGYSYERTVANGNCGQGVEIGSEYTPNGTLITEDENNKYYSNGIGGYYSEPTTPQITGYEGEEDRITVAGSSVVSRTRTRPQYSNGTNGDWSEWNYTPNGTFYASDESYNYYSNGSGGYYSEPRQQQCPSSGTQIGSDSGYYTVDVGCGNWVTGNWSSSTYADGSCGTYTNGSANYVSNGTLLGNCNNFNYYSNGSGGSYQGEYTGGGGSTCDSYGTWIEGSNSDIQVSNPCGGTWIVGASTYSVYADGNCGTYSESGSNYYSYETYLGNCNDYNYYSDGNGSYRQGEYTGSYPSAGSPTGNTSSGTNYLEINGVQYENGTYVSTQFHDGSGGYYIGNYQYSYTSYGHYFGSQSYYDWANMYDVYTYYYSDGTGGYYTSY
jgi:hypothetical protein